jgi:hypothetical protein
MHKSKLICNLISIHYLFENGAPRLALKELEVLTERLNSEILHDDNTSFNGHECIDLIEDYQAGRMNFPIFIRMVRERCGGNLLELKEFVERFRKREAA